MKRYINYLKYIIRHKWLVYKVGRHGLWFPKTPVWQLLIHDLTKLLPDEFFAYAFAFYNHDGTKRYYNNPRFKAAWVKHMNRNPHHWAYWVINDDDGNTRPVEIPLRFVHEMIADWAGAGLARGLYDFDDYYMNLSEWYADKRDTMSLHPNTKKYIDRYLNT